MARFSFSVNIFLILFVICISCDYSEQKTNGVYFDFEKIVNDLFLKSDFNNQNGEWRSNDRFSEKNDMQCLMELRDIQKGVETFQPWALKLIDAWGKLPSTVLSGNVFEFGGFSECFHIERNQELYKTQYCLGHLIVNVNGISVPKANNAFMPNIFQTNNESPIAPRMIIPQPENGPAIIFGHCLPSACSSKVVEPLMNAIIQQKVNNVTVELNDNDCQYQENITEWRTIDQVSLGVVVTVFCLILASTCYDVLCTINQSQKIQILLAFSLYTNGMKLLSYKKSRSPDVMACVNGIRVISTQWVVLGHSFLIYVSLPTRNKASFSTFAAQYHNMVVLAAPISVDTFFVLSGLFVTISMLKHLDKTKGKLNVPLLYFHRYLRLTPLLGMTVLISITLLRFLGNGPLWPFLMDSFGEQCDRNWWSTLLYVQNYANPHDVCLLHTWYLSVDMQLFWIAPLIIYSIYRFKSKTIPIWILFILGCIGCTLAVHVKHNFNDTLSNPDFLPEAYILTHLRYSSWLIGVIAGFFFYEVRDKTIRIPRIFNILAWLLCLTVMGTVIFAFYPFTQGDFKKTAFEFGLYEALSRVGWSIALCYVIFACHHGYGGIINSFLSHPLWQPLQRLSYSIYLVHLPVIFIIVGSMKTPLYFSELYAFHAYIGSYVIILFVSMIATLAFESPIIIIEKFLFGSTKKSSRNDEEKTNPAHQNTNGAATNQQKGTQSS